MHKKKKCVAIHGKSIHRFNGEKPFDWQRCMCKRFTYWQLKEMNRQSLIEEKGEKIGT